MDREYRLINELVQLNAAELQRLADAIRSLTYAVPSRGSFLLTSEGGSNSAPYQTESFLAKITGAPVGASYPWQEILDDSAFQTNGTRAGTAKILPAVEITGNTAVPNGTIVRLTLGSDWQHYTFTSVTGAQVILPTGSITITQNTNNLVIPAGTVKVYASVTGTDNLTGIVAGTDGQLVIIYNLGPGTLTLTNEDAASAAANRFHTPSGNGYVVYPSNAVILEYNATLARWTFDTPDVFLPSGASASTGLVPQPSLAAGTTKFLREDATWQTPAGVADNNNDWNFFRQVGTSPLECWYPAGVASSDTSITVITIASGTLLAYPFVAPRGGTLDRIGAFVSVGGAAGAKIRLGIYNATSSTNLYPSTLVVDSGDQVATASATAIKVTINQSLTAGNLYWFVILSNDSTIQLNAYPDGATFPILGSDSTLNVALNNQLTKAQAYGALPANFPAGASPNNDNIFLISVRYSA